MTQEQIEELRALNAKRTQGEWRVRPDRYDDWGYIRAANGAVVAVGRAGGFVGEISLVLAEHRRNGTDPYAHNAAFIAAAANHMDALLSLAAQAERMREALGGLLEHYVALVNSGDAGFWDPEKEPVVINARAALEPKP